METNVTTNEASQLRHCTLTLMRHGHSQSTASQPRQTPHQLWLCKTPGNWKAREQETRLLIRNSSWLLRKTSSTFVEIWHGYTACTHACKSVREHRTSSSSKDRSNYGPFHRETSLTQETRKPGNQIRRHHRNPYLECSTPGRRALKKLKEPPLLSIFQGTVVPGAMKRATPLATNSINVARVEAPRAQLTLMWPINHRPRTGRL